MSQVAADSRFAVVEQSEDLYDSTYVETNIPTELEKLFLKKAKPICYSKLCFSKIAASSANV